MRKAVYATAILIVIFLAQSVAVEANPYHFITSPVIELRSPCSPNYGISSPQRPFQYNTNHFNISLSYVTPHNYTSIDSFAYKINNGPIQPLNITNIKGDSYYGDATSYSVFDTVENLSSSIYNLKVYAQFTNGTTTEIMNSYVKIDLTPTIDPILLLAVSLIAILVITVLYYSTIKRIKNKTSMK
jgi:hypothetical protein